MKTSHSIGALFAAATLLTPSLSDAEAAGDVSLFSISKSENRNQVVYAVYVDHACRPAGPSPVHAYWRMLERGPGETAPLLAREQPAYGLASQEVAAASGSDERLVRVRLRALPERPIEVHTGQRDGVCVAMATARVASTPVSLFNIHARLRRLFFGVESITLSGREESGSLVQETVQP